VSDSPNSTNSSSASRWPGEPLLDARAVLHALEMRRDVWKARYVNLQQGGAAAAPKETRVRGGEMVEDAGWLL